MANTARKSASHLKIAPAAEPAHAPAQAAPPRPSIPPPGQTRTMAMIDDPHAPEFFTSRCCGFSIGQGNVTLTFESVRCNHFDPNGAMSRVVVGRVVMPIQAAQALVLELNSSLQGSGLSPIHAATAGMVAQ
jgi:hypothetical protein